MSQSASSMACNCRGGPTCCMRGSYQFYPYSESGMTVSKAPCAICSELGHEVAAHIGSPSHQWPRFHHESGECEQYGAHTHYAEASVIIWRRPEA